MLQTGMQGGCPKRLSHAKFRKRGAPLRLLAPSLSPTHAKLGNTLATLLPR